ncbi:MAG: MaoC family dehydratase [Hyphomicrobiaceae bacterium]|nr:MaoC family dehydratase [Hyphomicrobiaceae bacterium]
MYELGREGRSVAQICGSGYRFEDIEVGMAASISRTVRETDICAFADITGDRNPVHLDEAYAAETMFRERISHGMLTASYMSAVFGMELPGPGAIYISQTLNFRRPVKIGDTITATASVIEMFPAKKRVRFECVCTNSDGKPVVEGEAILMVPSREEA